MVANEICRTGYHGRALLAAIVLCLSAVTTAAGNSPTALGARQALVPTHGVAAGDVTRSSAVIWSRANAAARMHVQFATRPRFRGRARTAVTSAAHDFTATVRLRGLRPGTRYHYRVWFTPLGGRVGRPAYATGTFRTAPSANRGAGVRFVVGADLGGSRYCRNSASGGYAIFSAMRAVAPDFFVANGDMIYGDNSCPPEGPDGSGPWQNIPGDFQGVDSSSVDWTNLARTRDVYLRHWRYNRADRHLRAFLARTPIYSQWDDHEVINDFGAAWTFWNQASASRPGYPTLVAAGRSAFLDYAVLASPRIYRSFRWGRDLELFLLDNRSYRSRNDLPDTAANAKTMLGAEQFAWLLQSLRESSSTWKVVSSNVPLSVATGTPQARDGWASGTDSPSASDTGFERELLSLLAGLDAANVRNLVFVATDMHYPASFRYEHDYNGDGDTLVFHEFVTGPLSATRAGPRPPDATARPTVLYAEGNLFNFGLYNVLRAADGTTHFTAEVRDETGAQRPGSRIELSPR